MRATGPDDVLHYAWSAVGYPTVFISRSETTNRKKCLSNFHVNDYTGFISDQEPQSISIDNATTGFSFALIFKTLVEFKVSTKKLQGAGAFDATIAHNCSQDPRPDCPYYVYHLNNANLNWSSYDVSEGLRAYDTNGSLILHLKVRHL